MKELVEDRTVKPSVEVTLRELLLIVADDGTAIVDSVALRTGEIRLLDVVADDITEAANVKFEELEERSGNTTDVIVGMDVKSPTVGSPIDEKRVEFWLEVENEDTEPPTISTVEYPKETDGLAGYAQFDVLVRFKSAEVAADIANPEGAIEIPEIEALQEDVHEVEEVKEINPPKAVAL